MLLALMLTIAWTYHGLLQASFLLYDDDSLITSNPLVRDGDLFKIFTSFSAGLYHPLTTLSWALEAKLFGFDPGIFHATNIILHLLSTLLVWLLARRLWQSQIQLAPIILAALFALHPLNVESVAWISERKDLLCQVFYLLALYIHAGGESTDKPAPLRWTLVFASSVAAMLAKPMAVTLPLVLLLVDFYRGSDLFQRQKIFEKIPHLIVALLIAGLTIFGQTSVRSESPLSLGILYGGLNATKFLTFALSKGIWPTELSAIYESAAIPSLGPYVLRVYLLIAAFIIAWIKLPNWRRDASFGLLFFAITILPVVRFLQFGDASLFNDRFFYLPGIGLTWAIVSLLFSGLLQLTSHIHLLCLALILPIITWCANSSMQRSLVWQNDETLMRSVINTFPKSIKARSFLAQYLSKNNRHTEAAALYREALKLEPTDPVIHSGLAYSAFVAGQRDDALAVIHEAKKKWPNNSEILYATGVIQLESADLQAAYQNLNAALTAPSTMPTPYRLVQIARIHNNLAVTALRLNQPDEALQHAQRAVSGVGDLLPEAHYNHALVLRALSRRDAAEAALRRALSLSPQLHEAAADLAVIIWEKSIPEAAISMLQSAIRLAPTNTLYRCNLVHFYAKTNNLNLARATLQEIRELDPSASCLHPNK